MKTIFLLIISCIIAPTCSAQISNFFKPVPAPDVVDSLLLATQAEKLNFDPSVISSERLEELKNRANGTIEKKWRPVVNLPAFKLIESTRDDAVIDGLVLASVGGGISYQILEWDTGKGEFGGWKSKFSFSPLTVLITGNLSSDSPLDFSYATTLGFFDNIMMIGAGYDLGQVGDRSRIFGLVSVGINFND